MKQYVQQLNSSIKQISSVITDDVVQLFNLILLKQRLTIRKKRQDSSTWQGRDSKKKIKGS